MPNAGPRRRLTDTAAEAATGRGGGAGAAGDICRGGLAPFSGSPVVPGGHPTADLGSPWHTACLDAVGRTARLLAYPTGARTLVLKFPPGESATLFPSNNSIGALIEAVEFASWWRP